MKQLPAWLLVALVAALLGGISGALAAAFLHLVEWGQTGLWEILTAGLPMQALLLCTLGGLLVGLCQRYLGDHPKSIFEAVTEMRTTGRLDYAHLPQGLTTVAASLIFGASLGPESAIMDLAGGLGTWVGDQLTQVRQRLHWPLQVPATDRRVWWLHHWPNLLALAVGVVVFGRLLGGLYSGGLLHLSVPFAWDQLLWALPLGLLGGLGGAVFLQIPGWLKPVLAPLANKPVWRGLLGGLVLGLAGVLSPLVLFSGQHQMQAMYEQSATLGFWGLFALACARFLLVAWLLGTGWKGGQFLPIMFGGAALGLAANQLFPTMPAPAATLAPMAGLIAIALPQPILAILLMAALFPLQYLGISLVAIATAFVGAQLWKRLPRARPALAQ